jgi:hypothetical protein
MPATISLRHTFLLNGIVLTKKAKEIDFFEVRTRTALASSSFKRNFKDPFFLSLFFIFPFTCCQWLKKARNANSKENSYEVSMALLCGGKDLFLP